MDDQEQNAAGFKAQLIAEDGTAHELAGELKVGRVADCDIHLDNPKVSRTHALIKVDGEVVTEDQRIDPDLAQNQSAFN